MASKKSRYFVEVITRDGGNYTTNISVTDAEIVEFDQLTKTFLKGSEGYVSIGHFNIRASLVEAYRIKKLNFWFF